MGEIDQETHLSALALANAAALGSMIIRKVSSGNVSAAISGSVLTRELLESQLSTSILNKLNNCEGANRA